jgi:aminopeptidase N
LNETFYHKTVTSKDIEDYITKKSGKDLSKIFDQYLRNTKIPVLEYQFAQKDNDPNAYQFKFRWTNCIDGFNMPIRVNFGGKMVWINPTTDFKTMDVATEDRNSMPVDLAVDKNFYITVKKITQ